MDELHRHRTLADGGGRDTLSAKRCWVGACHRECVPDVTRLRPGPRTLATVSPLLETPRISMAPLRMMKARGYRLPRRKEFRPAVCAAPYRGREAARSAHRPVGGTWRRSMRVVLIDAPALALSPACSLSMCRVNQSSPVTFGGGSSVAWAAPIAAILHRGPYRVAPPSTTNWQAKPPAPLRLALCFRVVPERDRGVARGPGGPPYC